MTMPTVRTTMRPHEDLEVSEVELMDLRAQGLLVEDQPETDTDEGTKAGGQPVATKPASGPGK
jgi:hypothetical protein